MFTAKSISRMYFPFVNLTMSQHRFHWQHPQDTIDVSTTYMAVRQ